MALPVSPNALRASQQDTIEPQLALEIEGVPTIYGARVIQRRVLVGDTGLSVDGGWKVGGVLALRNQNDVISLSGGTTTSIREQLQPDKGIGASITSMQIALVDRGLSISKLVSPGVVVPDLLGRRAVVHLGFKDIAFPEDYSVLFRGIIDEIAAGPGTITLTLSHPDQKKRQTLFPKFRTTLAQPLAADETRYLYVSDADDLARVNTSLNYTSLEGLTHIDTTPTGINIYMKVDNEWVDIKMSAFSYRDPRFDPLPKTTLYTPSRGAFGTTPTAHAVGAEANVIYRLRGNVMDVALKLMLSNPQETAICRNIKVVSQNIISATERIQNALLIKGIDLVATYGISIGDRVVSEKGTGFIGQGDVDLGPVVAPVITDIDVRGTDTVLVLSGQVGFDRVYDPGSELRIGIFSKYQQFAYGLGMKLDEVDVAEHERLKQLFLSNHEVDIFIKEETNIKELIEQQLYASCGAYSVPKNGKASVGLHIAPIPGTQIQTLNSTNVIEASRIRVKRSLASNFMNTIIVKMDERLEEDDLATGVITYSADSGSRIPIGTKARVIEARALRSELNGKNLASIMSNRLLNRYRYGAESVEGVKVLFSTGYRISIGDLVLLDGASLGLLNSQAGDRSPARRFYEVTSKSIDVRTGECQLGLVDTNFLTNTRYGLISPSSKIKAGLSQTQFIIEAAYNKEQFGNQEWKKWSPFLTNNDSIGIKVRSPDFTTRFAQVMLLNIDGNTITTGPLGFVPQSGDVMEFANYDFSGTTSEQKAIFAYRRGGAFVDGSPPYQRV